MPYIRHFRHKYRRIKKKSQSINIVNSSLTKQQKQYAGARIVSSTNGAGTTEYPSAEKF